ncbi:MAG: FixH family protein [Acidobacteriia bacterium]|nr:FixH family protein [Terriglobia bacterium]
MNLNLKTAHNGQWTACALNNLKTAHNGQQTACALNCPRRSYNGFVRLAALFLCALTGALTQQREGNFNIRFEPTAVLQTGAPIPFQITVNDANHKALADAKVTLQIETANHTNVKVFPAPPADQRANPGIYIAKPVFPSAGEWSIYVEVHHQNGPSDEMSARTIQFSVPQ